MNQENALCRATFASKYWIRKSQRHPKSTRPRLGDFILSVFESTHPYYLQEAGLGEVCVIDLANRQKAWIETSRDLTPEGITAMIEGHFDASAYQVGSQLWVVTC